MFWSLRWNWWLQLGVRDEEEDACGSETLGHPIIQCYRTHWPEAESTKPSGSCQLSYLLHTLILEGFLNFPLLVLFHVDQIIITRWSKYVLPLMKLPIPGDWSRYCVSPNLHRTNWGWVIHIRLRLLSLPFLAPNCMPGVYYLLILRSLSVNISLSLSLSYKTHGHTHKCWSVMRHPYNLRSTAPKKKSISKHLFLKTLKYSGQFSQCYNKHKRNTSVVLAPERLTI